MNSLYHIAQLDKKLASCAKSVEPPKDGWLKVIRTTMGMTSRQLAERVGVTPRRVTAIEHGEVDRSIKLETLGKVADALGCELHYVLLPKHGGTLLERVERLAFEKAKTIVSRSGCHMSLEGQLEQEEMDLQVRLLAQELLHQSLKRLWDE